MKRWLEPLTWGHRFFIIGSIIALIGSIIGATAKDVNTLIAAEVFIGIAVAFQQSFVSSAVSRSGLETFH